MKSPKKNKRKNRLGRVAELALIGVFLVVMIVTINTVWKLTGSVTAATDAPEHLIRIQVVDGSGQNGVASRIVSDLSGISDNKLEIIVVTAENFGSGTVKRSFVITRKEDRTAAVLLAERIGLNPSEVVYNHLENNYQQISATLVIGEDYEKIEFGSENPEEL